MPKQFDTLNPEDIRVMAEQIEGPIAKWKVKMRSLSEAEMVPGQTQNVEQLFWDRAIRDTVHADWQLKRLVNQGNAQALEDLWRIVRIMESMQKNMNTEETEETRLMRRETLEEINSHYTHYGKNDVPAVKKILLYVANLEARPKMETTIAEWTHMHAMSSAQTISSQTQASSPEDDEQRNMNSAIKNTLQVHQQLMQSVNRGDAKALNDLCRLVSAVESMEQKKGQTRTAALKIWPREVLEDLRYRYTGFDRITEMREILQSVAIVEEIQKRKVENTVARWKSNLQITEAATNAGRKGESSADNFERVFLPRAIEKALQMYQQMDQGNAQNFADFYKLMNIVLAVEKRETDDLASHLALLKFLTTRYTESKEIPAILQFVANFARLPSMVRTANKWKRDGK